MKNPVRLVMIFSAGLSLAGCVSQTTATTREPAKKEVLSYGDKPQSAADHFYARDQDERQERDLLKSQQSR